MEFTCYILMNKYCTNNCTRNDRPTTASTPDKKMCVKCSSQKYKNNDQWNITKLDFVPWNSFQDHIGVWIPQSMYMMSAVSIIRKAQNKRDDFVSSHSCNNMLLVATNFSSILSLEMRHEFITIPQMKCASMERKHLGPLKMKKLAPSTKWQPSISCSKGSFWWLQIYKRWWCEDSCDMVVATAWHILL